MFYGDSDYDIDQIDLSVFATPKFDEIAQLYMQSPPDMAALMGPTSTYPRADVVAVGDLYYKLLGYLIGRPCLRRAPTTTRSAPFPHLPLHARAIFSYDV